MKTFKLIVILFLGFISFSDAQTTYTWTGDGLTDSYIELTNWSPLPTIFPDVFDTIIFNTGTDVTVTQVPDNLMLAGIKVIPSLTPLATKVNFIFTTTGNSITLNEILIGQGCSINYTDPAYITVNSMANLHGGSININADIYLNGETNIISQNTLLANNAINYSVMHLNEGELGLNCVLNNMGTINLDNGKLRIEKEFLSDINGFLYGGFGSTLVIDSTVTSVDPLPYSLTELNTFECYAPINILLTGNLNVSHLLKIMNGVLDFTDKTLTLSGDFLCDVGVLACGGTTSSINIDGSGSGVQSKLAFNVTGGKNVLNSLFLNRPDKIIDIKTNLIITNNLDLTAGKLKLWASDLSLNSLTAVAVTNPSYIITGPSGTVSKNFNVGDSFIYPVGTDNYSANVVITPQNISEFSVNVKDQVLSNGFDGTLLPVDELVNITWDIQSPVSNYNIVFNWDVGAQGSLFSSADASVFHYNETNNVWENISTTNAGTTGYISVDTDLSGLFMVSSKMNPNLFVEDQVFKIPEYSPNGTFVGQIESIDLTADIIYEVLDHNNSDAFEINSTGAITVTNSSLLVKSVSPEFKYPMIANNSATDQSSNFLLSIYLLDQLEREFIITNYISPNGDGVNDTWIVKGPDVGQYRVAIFDKGGNLVFRSEDYMNDWNGTMNGTRLSPGVYYYIVRSDTIEEKGTITLVR